MIIMKELWVRGDRKIERERETEREWERNSLQNIENNNYKEYCGNIDFEKDNFEGWTLESFFTFQQYHEMTNKKLVITGNNTKKSI